jgi:arsenite methyltransferase
MNRQRRWRPGEHSGTDTIRDAVRKRYAAAARSVAPDAPASCCGDQAAVITDAQAEVFGSKLYADGERDELPEDAVLASLGCGNPTAVTALDEGETVLDRGSGGAGSMCCSRLVASARRARPTAWT